MSAFYDYAIADLGAGVDNAVMQVALSSGRVFVVLNDEPTSMTDAYALIKRLWQSGRKDGVEIVVNMAQDQSDGRKTAATLIRAAQGFLNIELPVAGVLRRDPKVRDAIRRQQPFLARHPQSMAAVDVAALAEDLVRKAQMMPHRPALKLAAGQR